MPADATANSCRYYQGRRARNQAGQVYTAASPQEPFQLFNPPADYDWGYPGSGPSRLAFDLLLDSTGDKAVAAEHQYDFKERVIARLPYAGWTLSARQISRFLNRRQPASQAAAAQRQAA